MLPSWEEGLAQLWPPSGMWSLPLGTKEDFAQVQEKRELAQPRSSSPTVIQY